MMTNRIVFLVFLTVLALSGWMCATPTQPTGGPSDRTPPEIIETKPISGTTHFDGDRIHISFSKYVDRNSFQNALQIEPDLGIMYDISWRRRTARITFDEPLPDTTTIIFTLGTELRDTQNNALHAPYQLAVSTGPDIDSGKIVAKVKDAKTGKGLPGERVVLYRYPYDLEDPADYVAEADTAGVVRFNYLREGDYFAFWLEDRNRNRRWDPPRERAQPFWTDIISLEQDAEADAGSLYVMQMDTIPPSLLAVGMLSEIRMRLRFTKPVKIGPEATLLIRDEADSVMTSAVPLYVDPENSHILLAESRVPLPDNQEYGIELLDVMDLAGNIARTEVERFPGSDESDTTLARYIRHDTGAGLEPTDPLVIRYARILDPYSDLSILDSLAVVESQTAFQPWDSLEIKDNLLYVYPDGEWIRGESYEIRVWDDDRMSHHSIVPVIRYAEDTGSLHILIDEHVDKPPPMYLELEDENGNVKRSDLFTGEIQFDGLMPGTYLIRGYETREPFTGWDSGAVSPFRPPAKYFIQDNIVVERGMTGQIYIDLSE